MGFLGGWINVTTVSIALFTIYFAFTTQQLYGIMYPSFEDVDGPTLDPLWPEGEHLHSELYLSSRREWDAERDFADPFVLRVGDFSDLTLDWQDNARFTELNVSRASLHRLQKQEHGDDAAAADALWRALRSNGTVYLHVHVTRRGFSPNPAHATYAPLATVHQSNPLTRYAPRPNAKNATYLLAPYFPQYYPPEDTSELYNEVDPSDEGEDPAKTADVISFWKPHMAIRMVTDFTKYPHQEIPPLVFPNLRYHQMRDHSYKYTPSMYLDDMGLTMDKLVPLNRTVRELPLKISYEPMSYARWQILLTMEMAFKTQEAMGFTTNDLDSMRGMIADTNPYLLAVTMTVSLLHILFDWLAFKNDISDWRQRTSEREMVGVSLRAMVISLVSQAIICLYLLEEKTTLLILGPSIISLVLLVWKIFKVWRATSRAKASPTKSVMSTTRRADAMATNHLLFALAPLIVGFAAYSLVHKKHVSWYSWLLGSFTGAVYAFGFVLMTPQLVINYQLKSVAHLQWRYLIYRALNTFIDDLFAFIIHMPTMHRLSCFRDDIIFLIYVYQRWIYPVDKGRKFDDDDGAQGDGEGKASEIKVDKKND